MMALEGFDRLHSVTRFRNDTQIGFLVEDVRDAGSQERVVVHQQHASPAAGHVCGFSLQHELEWAGKSAPTPERLQYHYVAP